MKVAILGVGLIGGSIGLAARARAGVEVCGYDPDERVLARALELGALDVGASDVPGAVAGADIVFAAAPVGALAQTVALALQAAAPGCVVTDVGSTKRMLADAARDQRFIGGHPLAGAQTAGVEHAREDLFEGCSWYLTPAKGKTSGLLYERLYSVLRGFGARPVAVDADTHDRIMACVSHLPHVLANVLVAQAVGMLDSSAGTRASAHVGEELRRLPVPLRVPAVGPSFRDATRVAGANDAIWTDIYISNRDALIDGIDELQRRLDEVRGWLASADAHAIGAWSERARDARDALLGGLTGGADGEPVHELRVSVPNRPGVIAEIALALGDAGLNILDLALSPSPDNRQGVVALWIAGEQRAARAGELIAGLGFQVLPA
ncbi:MAG TPA: prephenate dehydrogenase/arogenate dehydrogenase family protein [Solirubrobacteraceae bacterium]|nr:prephenate dehydrogenase/arogenate dehydrogenase family protein [Solirubrobacteraceae bacterium]